MTEQDIPAGVRMNTVCGWNQTAADWARFIAASPHGCFVMEEGEKIVGTSATIAYEGCFAWIGMVLVDPEFRKKGIGSDLLREAVAYLEEAKVPTMKLDATPLGKPLYEKLGFVREYEIERWQLTRAGIPGSGGTTRAEKRLAGTEVEQILRLDRKLFGADRGFLLRAMHDDAPELAIGIWRGGELHGYSFGRHGRFADHLGPWVAQGQEAAELILDIFLERSKREIVIVDAMKTSSIAEELLRKRGFDVARPLTRMFRGPNSFPGQPHTFCAILGPEFG